MSAYARGESPLVEPDFYRVAVRGAGGTWWNVRGRLPEWKARAALKQLQKDEPKREFRLARITEHIPNTRRKP